MDFIISETEEFIVEHALNMLIKSLKNDPEAKKFIDVHIKMQNEKPLPECYIRFVESAKTKIARLIKKHQDEEKKENQKFIKELADL